MLGRPSLQVMASVVFGVGGLGGATTACSTRVRIGGGLLALQDLRYPIYDPCLSRARHPYAGRFQADPVVYPLKIMIDFGIVIYPF